MPYHRPQGVVSAMAVGYQISLIKTEAPSILIDEAGIGSDVEHISYEHIVASELFYTFHPAFYSKRRFFNSRRFHGHTLQRMQTGLLPFVILAS